LIHVVHHVADSFAWLREAESKAYDVIITDPPYPERVQKNLCSGSLVGTKNVPKYDLTFDALSVTQHAWLKEATRITRRWALSFCAVEDFGRFADLMGPEYVRGAIWIKPNAMGQLTGDRPATAYEGVSIFHPLKPKKQWNGRGSYGVWKCNGTRGKKDRHPNEKPIDLCLKLVALFSNRGETVLDPFCGSGAIGEACVRLGRSYVGLDQDKAWVAKARARLDVELLDVSDEAALRLCPMIDRKEAT
jgi:site-specific DNA-methyltransferase (adenine-specific)